ncbi:MAG: hypothetical protein RQ715_06170 [Methylococcales bacterium]|nr:hypothetical protein [Methylococcales bacterium]
MRRSGTWLLACLTLATGSAFAEPLFSQRWFSLQTDAATICTDHQQGHLPATQLRAIIDHYEANTPTLRQRAVAYLTRHSHPDWQALLAEHSQDCRQQGQGPLCRLTAYWQGDLDTALRVLALFYDTKTAIKQAETPDTPRFQRHHVRLFEKALRKLPPFMRDFITRARPIRNLADVLDQHNIEGPTRTLIQEAFPHDLDSWVWEDDTLPLSLTPGEGFHGNVVAQVFSGSNRIVFTLKNFDQAMAGNYWKDIGLNYLVDFRLPLVIHELGHVIDNFHFWDGDQTLYFFFWYHKVSNDIVFMRQIKHATLGLWPSRWFEAFEYLWEVNNGRYNGKINEKMAELFAQYMLMPDTLRELSPAAYHWLREAIFQGIEYQGYRHCSTPLTRPLGFWQRLIARPLGR